MNIPYGKKVCVHGISNSLRKLLKRAPLSQPLLARHRGLIIIKQLTIVDCHYRRGCASASIEPILPSTWNNFALYRRRVRAVRVRVVYARVFAIVCPCIREEEARRNDAALERLRFLHYDNYIRANLVEIVPVGCWLASLMQFPFLQ